MASKLPPIPYGSPPGSDLWNDWYEKLRTFFNNGLVGVLWANINFSGSNITAIVNRAHNNLQSLQGGVAGEYYHLTAAQHSALSAGPHNSLSGIQGGSATERYHLTLAQHVLATDYIHNNLNSLQGGSATERYHLSAAQHALATAYVHNDLNSVQGGAATERYHLTLAQHTQVAALPTGISATITTAKLTAGGTNGSMTFVNGLLTAQTAAT